MYILLTSQNFYEKKSIRCRMLFLSLCLLFIHGCAVNYLFYAVGREKIPYRKLLYGNLISVLLANFVITLGIFLLCAASCSPFSLVRLCGNIDKITVYVFLNFPNQLARQYLSCVFVRHFAFLLLYKRKIGQYRRKKPICTPRISDTTEYPRSCITRGSQIPGGSSIRGYTKITLLLII